MAEKKIVVMGGSFNPPTIAHYKLMRAAVDELKAEKGVFVPVSRAYLKRKMRKDGERICLSERLRTDMLRSMCEQNDGLTVSEMDLGVAQVTFYQTLRKAEEEFPDANIYLLAGIDKLGLIRKWAEASDLLARYGVVLFSRHDAEAKTAVMQDPVLKRFYGSFVFAAEPEGTKEISSSEVRKRMMSKESSEDLLHPKVWEKLKELSVEDFPVEIERFQGEYDFLGNDYTAPFVWDGLTYQCAEAAFQASKCEGDAERLRFVGCGAEKAKRYGKQCVPRSGWEADRLRLMEDILWAKFSQNPELAARLKATGNAVLVAGNQGKDAFWGMDLYSCRGENHLGEILMKIRAKE
ncbi:MAG: DUF1768 domain-containing protein [Oscillospiraceae bacterium]|nr:DUF1768 domain-containing protein [Oscillospiraceae bacterium]